MSKARIQTSHWYPNMHKKNLMKLMKMKEPSSLQRLYLCSSFPSSFLLFSVPFSLHNLSMFFAFFSFVYSLVSSFPSNLTIWKRLSFFVLCFFFLHLSQSSLLLSLSSSYIIFRKPFHSFSKISFLSFPCRVPRKPLISFSSDFSHPSSFLFFPVKTTHSAPIFHTPLGKPQLSNFFKNSFFHLL